MEPNKNNKENEKVQEIKKEFPEGKTYTEEEFMQLPKTAKRENGNSIYKMVNEKFPVKIPVRLVEVYKYLREISNAKNQYKTLWVAYYAKIKLATGEMVPNNNKIAYNEATTLNGEKLIMFYEKPEIKENIALNKKLQEANK